MGEARENAEREALLGILEADLPRLIPGLGVVDRGLLLSRGTIRVSEGRRADLVLLDDSGRALLVLLVDGRGDDTVLAAIDALAFARQNGDALARPSRPFSPREISTRVALVAESFSERVLESLSMLPERELMLLETRKLASETGSRTRLVRLEPMPPRSAETPASRESFLETVPEFLLGTAELLLRRLARVDAEIEFTYVAGAVEVRRGERELCLLESRDGALRGEIPSLDRQFPIRGMDDTDAFLDEVLREHLDTLEEETMLHAPTMLRRSGGRVSGGGQGGEPLLTAEEIAAFQD